MNQDFILPLVLALFALLIFVMLRTSKKPSPPKGSTVGEIASSILSAQFQVAGSDLAAISAAGDRVALGYVFSFPDALWQAMTFGYGQRYSMIAPRPSFPSVSSPDFRMPGSSVEGQAALNTSFALLAGDAGDRIRDQCVALQSDSEFLKGVEFGGQEAFALAHKRKTPLGLASYLEELSDEG